MLLKHQRTVILVTQKTNLVHHSDYVNILLVNVFTSSTFLRFRSTIRPHHKRRTLWCVRAIGRNVDFRYFTNSFFSFNVFSIFTVCVFFCVVSVFSSFMLRQQQQKISQLIWIHHILNNLGNNGNNNTANDDNLHTNGPIDIPTDTHIHTKSRLFQWKVTIFERRERIESLKARITNWFKNGTR